VIKLLKLFAFSIVAIGSLAQAAAPFRAMPAPGVRHYVYTVSQTVNGRTHNGYRTEFDLDTRNETIVAIVRSTSELNGAEWKPVVPDAACRAAMHGNEKRLARVTLYPLPPQVAHSLNDSFLATCAPPAVFFPLTDILNAAIIPVSSEFRAPELTKVGQVLTYAGFHAAFDRPSQSIEETSRGGQTRLAALGVQRATIDWEPLPADITIIERAMQQPMTLKGTEHFAFRVEVDRRSGAIERAVTTFDNLDLAIVGVPPSVPHVRISRRVSITRK
jgi:hypothetical protein